MGQSDYAVYIACPACDLLHLRSHIEPGTTARCVRCATVLYRNRGQSVDRPLCFFLAGLILFVLANLFPFLTLEIEGRSQETVLVTGVLSLYRQGELGLAGLVLLTGMAFPLLQLLGYIYVLLSVRMGVMFPNTGVVYRWVRHIQPWSMMEIFLLGLLVSVVKLSDMAEVVPGVALLAFVLLIFLLPSAMVAMDSRSIWDRLPIRQAA